MKRVEFEAVNITDAENKAVELLGLPLKKIKIEVIKEKKGFLGFGGSTTYEASFNGSISLEGKSYLESIFSALEIPVRMEVRTLNDEKEIYYRVESDNNALLIGREGRTLLAFQTLLRKYISDFTNDYVVVSLDIGSYNENRKRQLEILATKTAKEVAFTKVPVKLDPMNAYERRIIHTKLSEWRDVETISEGEGEERSLIIKPKE